MATSSILEYWNGSAWVKENNLIQLTITDKLQEPLVLEAMIGNFSDSALNTRESNYGKFLKVRAKEKFSEKYIFYGKVVKTTPDRDGTWGHVVHVRAIDNLRELSNLQLDNDVTGCTTRSRIVYDIIQDNVWMTGTIPNIAVDDATKFKTSLSVEAGTTLNLTFKGDKKSILDIMQEVAREDPNGDFFGYDFYLDAEFNGNTPTPDLFYFPRSSIPAGSMPASGLTLEYAASESNQVLPIMGDYNFPRQSSEMITRVLIRWIDFEDKPRKTECILINHGATSGGNFSIDDTITWSGSGSAKVQLVGSNNRWLVIGPSLFSHDDHSTNKNWLKPVSGLTISGGGASATVNAANANPPGSLREAIEQEAEISSQKYDISTPKAAAVHAASILYQGGDIVVRGQVKTLKWPQYKITGTHTGSDNASTLTDSTKTFTNFGIFKSDVVKNTSDNSTTAITAVGSTTITGTLSGGTDNNWDTDDTYEIAIPIRAGHLVYVKGIPSGSGISNQVCLVTGIDYTEGPGIQIANIQLLIASDGRGTIPAMPAKMARKASENASAVPAIDQSGIKPRSSVGWTTTVTFTPDGTNSHNTVDWASGSIHFFDGTNFSISSGTTGAISAVTYIYFSKASPTVLQSTTSATTAQGSNNIVLATCENVASGGTVTIETTTGVAQKNHYSLDTLFDGAAYGRIAVGNLLSNNLNFASSSIANKTMDNIGEGSTYKRATQDTIDGGAKANTGLTSQGFISQNHFLNDLGIGIRSNSGSTYTAILGAGIVGINGSTTMFQIQASDGKAGFGMNSSGTFTCTLDNFGVRLGMNTTGGSSTGLIEFNSPAVGGTPANRYHLTNYFGVFQILGDNTHILRPSNEGGWKFGDVTLYWGNIYNVTYQVRRASGSPATFSTLTSNSSGDLLWNGSAISSGVTDHGALGGLADDDHSLYKAYNTVNNWSNRNSNTFSSSTLPGIYSMSSPIQSDYGMWFANESTPGNPASGYIRIFSNGDTLKYKKSNGSTVTLDGGGSALTSHENDASAHHSQTTNTWRPVYSTSSSDSTASISRLGLQNHEATTHGGGSSYTHPDPIQLGTGGGSAPTYSFSGSTSTGMWLDGGGLNLSRQGNLVLSLSSTYSYNLKKVYITDAPNISSGGSYVKIDSGTLKTYTSSQRAKMDIQSIVFDTSKIYDLEAKSFRFRAQQVNEDESSMMDEDGTLYYTDIPAEGEDSTLQFGMIAEEVYEHLPELVSLNKNTNQPIGIDYPLLSVLLLEEMKKLKARIEVLEGA